MHIDPRFEPVLREMESQIDTGLRPSIQAAVRWRGELVLDAARGPGAVKDRPYVLWSSTKPLVAVALLQAVEEGLIDLDERVGKRIPEFARHGKEAVTVIQLLTHRGGFPGASPKLAKQLSKLAPDFDACIQFVCDLEALWEPGTDRGYHPASSWYIVAELVQRLRDQPLAEVLRQRVLEPCGIPDHAFCLGEPERLREKPVPVQTNGERGAPDESEARFWNDERTHESVIPGASGIGIARELTRFYQALLQGGRGPNGNLLSARMVRVATFPHAVGTTDRTFLRDIPWGLGFHLKHVRPSLDDCGDSASPGTFGHAGHFLVNTFWADPVKELAVGFLSNGLTAPKRGMDAVNRLSESVHRVVDALVPETE